MDLKKLPFPIHFQESVDSTQAWAKRTIQNGGKSGEIFVANFQEHGRGRFDRQWLSDPGQNLLVTLVDLPPKNPQDLPHLSLVSGVALFEGISTLFPDLKLQLKWPNDLLINGKKTAGILCEAFEGHAFIGVGINCNMKDFPKELVTPATSLTLETNQPISKEEVLKAWVLSYRKHRAIYDTQGLTPFVKKWNSFLADSPRKIRVSAGNIPDGPAEIVGLSNEGFLRVHRNGEIIELITGDVLI